MKIGYYLLVKC